MRKISLLMCLLMMFTSVSCGNDVQLSESEISSKDYSSSEKITESETENDTSMAESETSSEPATEEAAENNAEAENSDTAEATKADEAQIDEMSDIYDCAYNVIELMSELSSNESYIELTAAASLSDEYNEIKDNLIIDDVTAPRSVYRVTGTKEFSEFMIMSEISGELGFSDNIKESLEKRLASNIAVTFNQTYGVQKVAMASIMTASQMFVRESITEDQLYIFMYEDCYPVSVSFSKGNEGAVSVNTGYIFADELINCDKEAFESFLDSTVYSGLLGIEQIK